MYIGIEIMYICGNLIEEGIILVATVRNRAHKHFQLDASKIRRAKKALQAKTETETIERALDLAIEEHDRNRRLAEANEQFIRSGIDIKDVYGNLDE